MCSSQTCIPVQGAPRGMQKENGALLVLLDSTPRFLRKRCYHRARACELTAVVLHERQPCSLRIAASSARVQRIADFSAFRPGRRQSPLHAFLTRMLIDVLMVAVAR